MIAWNLDNFSHRLLKSFEMAYLAKKPAWISTGFTSDPDHLGVLGYHKAYKDDITQLCLGNLAKSFIDTVDQKS